MRIAGEGSVGGAVIRAARAGWSGTLPRRYEEDGYRRFEAAIAESLLSDARVLDVGAGNSPTVPVEDRPPGVFYTGLDASAKELSAAPPDSYDRRIVARIEDFDPGLRREFSLILSRFAFEHVESLAGGLGNARRYLRPGGRLLAVLSGRNSVPSVLNRALPSAIAVRLLRRLHGRAPETVFPARYDRCTSSAISTLLADGWAQSEVLPIYTGGRYFAPSRVLSALYLAYEEWVRLTDRRDLAAYYFIDARVE